jgi:2-dehydropantoate 2-reductase
VDLILFCVKTYDVDDALERMQPMVGSETAILPVLNGIEHVAKMQVRLGEQYVLGGLAMISVHKGKPGVIYHVADAGRYQLEFGEWAGGISSRCEQIQEVLSEAGLDTTAVSNIAERMWWKLAAFSGVIVLAVMRGDKATVWAEETKVVVHKAVSEAVAVATAQGISIAGTLPDNVVKLGDKLPPDYKPSLLVDLEQGNRLELEAITGFLTRLGKEGNVPTPTHDFIYACLKPYVNGAALSSL